jgi:Tol biopolymer transport system component
MLWLRPIDEVAARPLAGTQDGRRPFWSPDSREVGFASEGKVKKIPAIGGAAQVVVEGIGDRSNFGITWGAEGVILFGYADNAIYRIPAVGGQIAPVTKLDLANGETNHRWPQFLPDGRHFLYTVRGGTSRSVFVGSLDGATRKLLLRFDSRGIYSLPGYLLFVDGDSLLGQAFDAGSLEMSGQPFTVAEHAGRASNSDAAVSASSTGALAYAGAMLQLGRLTWFDRSGNALDSIESEGDYPDFRLSPDGKRLAATQVDPKTNVPTIWLYELERGNRSRLTEDSALNASAVWSPDGARLVFRTIRRGVVEFYQRSAFGGGNDQLVLGLETKAAVGLQMLNLTPTDWFGQQIVYSVPGNSSGTEMWLFPVTENAKPVKLVSSTADKMHANFSPNGRLLAYTSNESGKFEVKVQTVPLSDRVWTVSTNGGYEPRWRADGREIYYLSSDRNLMAVEVGAGPSFGVPKTLFQTRVHASVDSLRTHYVPARDGRRFLVNTQTSDSAANPITVVLNWTLGLKE